MISRGTSQVLKDYAMAMKLTGCLCVKFHEVMMVRILRIPRRHLAFLCWSDLLPTHVLHWMTICSIHFVVFVFVFRDLIA